MGHERHVPGAEPQPAGVEMDVTGLEVKRQSGAGHGQRRDELLPDPDYRHVPSERAIGVEDDELVGDQPGGPEEGRDGRNEDRALLESTHRE